MSLVQHPGELYWSVVEPFWRAVSIYDGSEIFLRQFHTLPSKARHLFATHWCQSEVRNGGYYQFFTNPTGVLAPEALAGFEAIGLTEWAATLAEAMRFFGEPFPREQAGRQERLAESSSSLQEELARLSTLDERVFSWLHANPEGWERAADRFAATPEAECSSM